MLVSELVEKFEVSIRMIYCDMDMLFYVGFLVVVLLGKNGGFIMFDIYKLVIFIFLEVEK